MRNTELSVTKSMLAKLLAGENITVVHERIKTAFFDLKTRTLHLPIFENMDGPLYDLLVGHEDGHALYTPEEGWHSEIINPERLTEKQKERKVKYNAGFKGVLNVCEDARIEKLIKRKYPGIGRSFVIGYQDLYARDFFGIKRLKSLEQLNIVDRVNLYAKCGSFLVVPFNDEERELLREVMDAETWDQTVDVATKLYARAIEERDEYINSMEDLTEKLLEQFSEDSMSEEDMKDMFSQGEDEQSEDEQEGQDESFKPFDPDGSVDDALGDDDDSKPQKSEEESDDTAEAESTDASGEEQGEEASEEEGEGSAKGEESEEGEESDSAAGGEEESDEDSDDNAEAGKEGGKQGGKDSGEEEGEEKNEDADIESVTDRIFREREQELYDSGDTNYFTYNFPKPILENIIVPNKVMVDNFHDKLNIATKLSGDVIAPTCIKKFNDANMRYINLLVKEFEMRKNASQYARTTVARTGELDMNKLHQYRFTSNIFKKMNVVPKGKNHGMVMFVDMSGSMSKSFGPTMEQCLILTTFCRKVGIPFDVYGFSDDALFTSELVMRKKLPANFNATKFQKLAGDNYDVDDDRSFNLRHIISSSSSPAQYKRAYEMLAVVAMNWKNQMFPKTNLSMASIGFRLNGTPFTQTVMASRPIIEKFRAAHRVDIANVVYLTDGEGYNGFKFKNVPAPKYNYSTGTIKNKSVVYMVDPVTKERLEIDPNSPATTQKAVTEFVRHLTGCKHIGFYTGGRHDMNYVLRTSGMDEMQITKYRKQLREEGYFAIPNIGYDNYFYVQASEANIEDDDYEFTENMTKRKMASVFADAQNSKRKHRTMASMFAKDFATI